MNCQREQRAATALLDVSSSVITDALTQSSASPVEANSQPKSDAHVAVGAARRGRAFSASCSAIALRISNLDHIFGAGGSRCKIMLEPPLVLLDETCS